MYLIVIAWLYVALMMGVAEATNSTGTVLGGLITFVLYGLGPVALVVYLMGSPARRKALKAREAAEWARQQAQAPTVGDAAAAPAAADASAPALPLQPDTGGEAPADPVAPVRKEP
ncbi:hypothetical protein [Variovorax terrae]|uniref:Transmembrane protein n=1 Tax=Variovorax terrae TaxID=2923278 RepID=A0A9X1VXC9_9BURK|nr:hypothetical protein [Variovorax terrae]MCJ0763697.1 hypothetical protein [Variovorax terrae]